MGVLSNRIQRDSGAALPRLHVNGSANQLEPFRLLVLPSLRRLGCERTLPYRTCGRWLSVMVRSMDSTVRVGAILSRHVSDCLLRTRLDLALLSDMRIAAFARQIE